MGEEKAQEGASKGEWGVMGGEVHTMVGLGGG